LRDNVGTVTVAGGADSLGTYLEFDDGENIGRVYANDSESVRLDTLAKFFVLPDGFTDPANDNQRDKSLSGRHWERMPTDFDFNGRMTDRDAKAVFALFGSNNRRGDVHGDGYVGLDDVQTVLESLGEEVEQTNIPVGVQSTGGYNSPEGVSFSFDGDRNLAYHAIIMDNRGRTITEFDIPGRYIRSDRTEIDVNDHIPGNQGIPVPSDEAISVFVYGRDRRFINQDGKGYMTEGGLGYHLSVDLESNNGSTDLPIPEPTPGNLYAAVEVQADSAGVDSTGRRDYAGLEVVVDVNGQEAYRLTEENSTVKEGDNGNLIMVSDDPIPSELIEAGENIVDVYGARGIIPVHLTLSTEKMPTDSEFLGDWLPSATRKAMGYLQGLFESGKELVTQYTNSSQVDKAA
jgi:hypothetical protein